MNVSAPCESDRDFELQMLIARLRWNLERPALQIAAKLRQDGLSVSAANIEAKLIANIAKTKPRSAIVPWHLSDRVVRAITHLVAANLAEQQS
jgi:hypothetical protein